MSGITITKSGLISRTLRNLATSNQTRRLNLNHSFQQQTSGLLERIWDFGRGLAGFLFGAVRNLRLSVTAIYGWLIQTGTALSQFDWNATDAELEAAMQQRNIQIAATWGAATGTTLGQILPIAIGAGVTYFIPAVGPAISRAVIAEAAPEALEEITTAIKTAVATTANVMIQNATTSGYINLRKLIKSLPRDTLRAIVGDNLANAIKDVWGTESAPRLTFADGLENRVESVQNPYLRAFTEEAVDEFFDSFIESGFMVARSIDQAIAESRAAIKQEKGQTRTVLVQPDERVPGEAFAYTGSEQEVKGMIQTSINSYRTIANRDVGQIVGQPAEDWYRARPQRRKLTVVFRNVETPPYYRNSSSKTATYTIPEPKNTLTWEKIKRACKAYTWGKYRCTANLTNGRQMAVYGATPAEAEDKLKDLLELSDCEISTLSVTEEKDRNPRLRKDPTRLYPATATMLVRRPSIDNSGRTDMNGDTWDEEHVRFELWTEQEPESFQYVRFGVGNDADS